MNLYEWLSLLISALMLAMHGIERWFLWHRRLGKPQELPAEGCGRIKRRKK